MFKQPACGIIIFLCKYYVVLSDLLAESFLDVFFLLLTVKLSELYEKPRRIKIELQKNVLRRICVKDLTQIFLTARPPFMSFFIVFFVCSLPLPM